MTTLLFFSPAIVAFIVSFILAGYKGVDGEDVIYYAMAVLFAFLWFITVPMIIVTGIAAGLYWLGKKAREYRTQYPRVEDDNEVE